MHFNNQNLWSDNNDNTFKGDGIHIDGLNEKFSLGNSIYFENGGGHLGDLDVAGILEMGASGKITNANDDYELTKVGLHFNPSSSYQVATSLNWGSNFGIGGWYAGSAEKLQYKADLHDFTDANGNIALQIQTGPSGSRLNVPDEIFVNKQLKLPVYNNNNRPSASGLAVGSIIYNNDEGTIQYVNGNHVWEETQ